MIFNINVNFSRRVRAGGILLITSDHSRCFEFFPIAHERHIRPERPRPLLLTRRNQLLRTGRCDTF